MVDFIARAVLRLREDRGFSRNRHFHALRRPREARARIHRHLRSLERDLSSAAATVAHEAERVRLVLREAISRTARLTRAEFRLLCTSPLVRALGEGAGDGF
jgi:hypothetical protein